MQADKGRREGDLDRTILRVGAPTTLKKRSPESICRSLLDVKSPASEYADDPGGADEPRGDAAELMATLTARDREPEED